MFYSGKIVALRADAVDQDLLRHAGLGNGRQPKHVDGR